MDASDAQSSDSLPSKRESLDGTPAAKPAAAEVSADKIAEKPTKTLTLMKGGEQFCFRYEVGEESQVLDAMVDLVNRRELAFDWFDAAVLSHQLGQVLAKELKTYLPKKAA